ncbi:MAG: CoA transferase [Phenylobacterium sp.]|uniref:CaiB/BaiF CoA transferase family protein n=1 Tax=Phenylobacterium sp. TaxID=1871053 RepID=UPI001A4F5B34|nr:CoA transferase [Phenylobacterium sp.]MBL8553999.1 CoA transferase [Phenylobacterium sp.]
MFGPLHDVRVLDLTGVVSGPFGAMWLADQGADVIKVEPPVGGDQGRYVGAGFLGYSALFATCNRNKRSIALDLAKPEGVEVALALAARADVVLENFRPGVAERLGIGYRAVRERNPQVIYASISGYGPQGPYAGRRTYDSIVQAGSGLADMQAGGREPPQLVNSIICDKVAGLAAAQAVTAALYARAQGGGGQQIFISMLEATLAFNWPDVMWNETFLSEDFRPGLTIADTYRLWPTRDGHIAIVFISGSAFQDWCRALSAPPEVAGETFETEADSRLRWLELRPLWEARIAALDTEEALRRFHAEGVPAGRVARRGEVAGDPQVVSDGSIVRLEHPEYGPMQMARPAARFAGFRPPAPRVAPALGGDSLAILEEIGMGGERAERLLRDGVVRTQAAPAA